MIQITINDRGLGLLGMPLGCSKKRCFVIHFQEG